MKTISLQPDPRLLEVLGQIELKGWQALAEFTDNSIDGILSQEKTDAEKLIEIFVPAPREIEENRKLRISDNGSGMNEVELENSLRAGYTGRTQAGDLGMFGVGFNIATARLGAKAIIWTSKKDMDEDIGVIIDLQEMKESGSFERELITRQNSKTAKKGQSGTSIEITDYYPRAKTLLYYRGRMQEELNSVYSASFLNENNLTIKFNEQELSPRPFCVWDEKRRGSYDGKDYPVIQHFDEKIDSKWYCTECICYYDESDDKPICIQCNSSNKVIRKNINVKGWFGLQRYFDRYDYGIDIIRNGRVIKSRSKDLFTWHNREGRGDGYDEDEYPKDSLALGGRIVGEMHVDFIIPTYTKDNFTEDNLWWQAVDAVRGVQPLQPKLATKRYKYPKNTSPLSKLFYPFRYKNPGSSNMYPANLDGSGANNICLDYAKNFYAGDEEYQDDTKWWKLIENYENRTGIEDDPIPDAEPPPQSSEPPEEETKFSGPKIFVREIEFSIDENYEIPPIKVSVKKYISTSEENILVPIILLPEGPNKFECLIIEKHEIYKIFPENWLDLLIMDVSNKMINDYRLHLDEEDWNFSRIFYLLKKKYNPEGLLGIDDLSKTSKDILKEIHNHLIEKEYPLEKRPQLSGANQATLKQNYLDHENKKLDKVTLITDKTFFLKYMPLKYVTEFLVEYFYLLTDDSYFAIPYKTLEDDLTQMEAQEAKFKGYLNDLFFASYVLPEMPDELQQSNKLDLIRCSTSIQMLSKLKV